MYKIVQNFPVIVKQPLFLKSTNLLKSQGSLFLCTKVKLHENSNEFETEVSKAEIRVSNKKEPGKNIEVDTPAVIYLSESPTSSYPLDDFQLNVHTSSPYQTDPNISNKIKTKYDVIILRDKNNDSSKENISEKTSSSVLHHTELSNNDVKNDAIAELIQESNEKENKKWNWNMYKNTTQEKNNNLSSLEPIIFIGGNRENNEQKLENEFAPSNPESSSQQVESPTPNNISHITQLKPFKPEILSSNAVKSTKTECKTPFIEKLKAFIPPSKNKGDKHDYNIFVQDHRTEIKQKEPLITNKNNIQFKEAQLIAKLRAKNPLRAQNIVTFEGKPAQIPINPNISFTNPVIETIRENRLVNPKTGQSFYKKMASDPILKSKTYQPIISGENSTQISLTKFNITSISQKNDTMETKIPSFSPSNPATTSCNNRTTLSKETVYASESSKVTTLASSIKKLTTTDASSRILANTTSINKNFAASIEPFSKTIPNVPPPSEKQIPIEISVNNTINSSSSCKTVSPESPPSKQQTNTLKLSPRLQDIPSQNTIKPTSSGGVQFQIPGRLLIAFTCKKCNTRNSKKISKHAYTKGVVIIRCDGCKNNHLIADNLKWFSDMGKKRNIEDIMAEKGEKVTKIVLPGGISEFLTDS